VNELPLHHGVHDFAKSVGLPVLRSNAEEKWSREIEQERKRYSELFPAQEGWLRVLICEAWVGVERL
jgi:hypothetical protein